MLSIRMLNATKQSIARLQCASSNLIGRKILTCHTPPKEIKAFGNVSLMNAYSLRGMRIKAASTASRNISRSFLIIGTAPTFGIKRSSFENNNAFAIAASLMASEYLADITNCSLDFNRLRTSSKAIRSTRDKSSKLCPKWSTKETRKNSST
jgi:hypothetical protein